MTTVPVTEGTMDFNVPAAGKPCQTWYKVYGDVLDRSHTPTIIIHGGPGCPHYYIEPIARTLATRFSIPAIVYDQLGCGNSTHLRERNTKEDDNFWTVQLFLDELRDLIGHLGIRDGYNIIGHSWGGVLAASFAVKKPVGLKNLVLLSTPAHMGLFVKSLEQLITTLPAETQAVISKHRDKPSDSREYQEAYLIFIKNFACRLAEIPEPFQMTLKSSAEDPTVSHIMYGPSDFDVTGTLKDYNVIDELHNISVPTLLTNGWNDEMQNFVVEPYFKRIEKVKWVQFSESAHFPWLEEEQKFYEVLGTFLQE